MSRSVPEAHAWDWDLDDVDGAYLTPGGEFLVGEVDRCIIAMGGLRLRDDGSGQIKRMRVHPDFQGRGYGRALLERLEERARDLRLSVLMLDTSPVQVAARALYASAGYVEVSREERLGLEMIFMQKALAVDSQPTEPGW